MWMRCIHHQFCSLVAVYNGHPYYCTVC
jgi:hypothetical protein